MRQVYLNGKFVPENEAKVSIYDSALMFGDMVFDMTRSFNKKQFKLKEHIQRLYDSAKMVHINIPITQNEMEQLCYETIEKNESEFLETDEHRIFLNVSRGPLSIYSNIFDGKIEPTIIIADFPLKWTVQGMGKMFDSGVNAVIPSQRAIPAHLMDPKIKNRSRLFYQLANIEVSQFKGDNNWALLLDPDGFITEATGANFFIIKNKIIYTPEVRNILRGISRDYIFELAEQLEMKCVEKNIEKYDVVTADEAFMTGTPFSMLPVTQIEGMNIGNGKRGKNFDIILEKWSENVGVNIENQIKKFNEETSDGKLGSTPYKFTK